MVFVMIAEGKNHNDNYLYFLVYLRILQMLTMY